MISFLFFFADWLVNIPDALGTNQQERVWSKWGQINTEIQNRYSAFLWRIFPVRAKIQTPKSKNKMLFIREFCGFTFSHRKPFKKNTAPKIRMRQFFFPKIVIFRSTLPIKWTFSLVLSSTFSQKYSFSHLLLSFSIYTLLSKPLKFQVQQSIYSFKLSSITGN